MKKFLLGLFIGQLVLLYAQENREKEEEKQPIEIIHADKLVLDEKYPGLKLLVGDVMLKHKNAVLTSDKALVDLKENFAEAIDNVNLDQDTLHLEAGILRYDGNREFAVAIDKVLLTDSTMQLHTDTLYYDLKNKTAYYNSGGTIIDSANILQSRTGRYYAGKDLYEFIGNVHLQNPEYQIESAHLNYNTRDKSAVFYGPTTIKSERSFIYAEKGFYDTKNDIAWFTQNTFLQSENSSLRADSVYMDKERSFYSATGHVQMKDTKNKTLVFAGYAEQWKAKDSVFLTENPVIVSYEEDKDTLYIRAENMYLRGKQNKREFFASPQVLFLQNTFSGRADSLYRSEEKKIIELLRHPVLWTEDAQITGSKILIKYDSTGRQPDSLIIPSNVFIIQKDSAGYNQIKGNLLKGKFIDGKLRHITITGNTEMIYYVRDEKDNLIGIDKSVCSEMELYLDENGKMEKVVLKEEPQGTTYPPDQFPEKIKLLEGFQWLGDQRITSARQLLEGNIPAFTPPSMRSVETEITKEKLKLPKRLMQGL